MSFFQLKEFGTVAFTHRVYVFTVFCQIFQSTSTRIESSFAVEIAFPEKKEQVQKIANSLSFQIRFPAKVGHLVNSSWSLSTYSKLFLVSLSRDDELFVSTFSQATSGSHDLRIPRGKRVFGRVQLKSDHGGKTGRGHFFLSRPTPQRNAHLR